MAIKYIFNGYYRSGTTLVWNILKNENPNYKVFYEPLHPGLLTNKLPEFKKKQQEVDELHGKKLWGEYLEQGEPFINKLKNFHVFSNNVFPSSNKKLFDYLDVYNRLGVNSILQTNRLHFHLENLIDKYDSKCFHIIRNPYDVYKSLIKIYNKKRNIFKYIIDLFYFLKNFHSPKSNIFLAKENINYVHANYFIPKYWNDNQASQKILKNPFRTHLLSWILCNYFALNNKNKEINIILYENLVSKPSKVKEKIEKNTDLKFDIDMIKKRRTSLDLYKTSKILEEVNFLNMNEKYHYILENIK